MDDYDEEDIPPGLPLTADELALAHYDVPRDLGTLPFGPDDMITRSLWVVYVGIWGIWTHAVLPVDNRLDMADTEDIAGLCGLVAGLIRPSVCHDDEEAIVVLRRPAPPDPSPADEHIFRLIREAAAPRETAPWSFFITGPDGARELHAPAAPADLSAPACPAPGAVSPVTPTGPMRALAPARGLPKPRHCDAHAATAGGVAEAPIRGPRTPAKLALSG